jgi:fructokinase
MSFTIVGIGEVLWDVLPSGREMGGAPANFAVNAHLLGAEGIVVSCVGADGLGREIHRRLDERSIVKDYVFVDSSRPTGTVSVRVDADGGPDYVIHEDVAWDYMPSAPELLELAGRIDAVCFGTLAQRSAVSRGTIRSFLGAVPARALRIFDVNLRQSYYSRETVESSLRIANVLKLNEFELGVVSNVLSVSGNEHSLLAKLAGLFELELVALTLGARGSLLYRRGEISSHTGFEVEVVNSVGAGDAFAAALAVGMLNGQSLDELSESANRAAADACARSGAAPFGL